MLNQNIAPSLRQSMINEALNYHQNMNSVVFRREPHNIQVYNNPSGKTDPTQNDILVEGNIRTRITEIQSHITKLNQALVYSTQQVAPVYSGSGRKASRRSLIGGVPPKTRSASVEPQRPPFPPLPRGPVKPFHPQQGQRPSSPSPRLPRMPPQGVLPPPIIAQSSSGESLPPVGSDPRIEGIFRGTHAYPPKPPGEESDISREPEGQDIYGADWAEGLPASGASEGTDEPIAPGVVSSTGPSANDSVSRKTRMIIDSSLASILSSYNSLIDFIELQSKQHLLSTKDNQIISGLLKEIVPPLKNVIVSAQMTVKRGQPNTQVDYTRIYNVISGLIEKVTGAPPFLKVDPQLLSESLPIRKDIINAKGFDPQKAKNHIYFENLLDRLKGEEIKLFKFHPKSEIEKQAREDKLARIREDYTTLTQAGYKPSEQVLKGIQDDISAQVGEVETIRSQVKENKDDTKALTAQFREDNKEFKDRIADLKRQVTAKGKAYQLAKASNARNTPAIESEYQDLVKDLEETKNDYIGMKEEYEVNIEALKPYGKFTKENARSLQAKAQDRYQSYEHAYEGTVPEDIATQEQKKVLFHKPNIERETQKSASRQAKYSKLKKAPASIFGQGKPKVRRGGSEILNKPLRGGHKASSDPFGDQPELEPYLTKYLRPSKHRRNVQPIESSSDESSGSEEEEAQHINKPMGGKKNKEKEDWDIILSQPKAEAGILIEKKKGRGRPTKASLSESQAIKPAHTTAKSQDYWFM